MTVYLADRGRQAPVPDRQPSHVNFSSNNPFRNRITSPLPPTNNNTTAGAAPSPAFFQHPATQPLPGMSKNPFLDASETSASSTKDNGVTTIGLMDDIFKDLALLDKPSANGNVPLAKSGPIPPRSGILPPAHRPTGSDQSRGAPRLPHGPDSPSKREHRPRPRGMSESSVIDEKERRERRDRERERGERQARTESEERRRRERRREREERHRREKEKIRNGGKMKKPQGLDIIDKLDVTGVYGQGLFHHDGPFDACNPHRNKPGAKSSRPAPMQAFPADSMNMALGGSGPLRTHIDLDKFHGRGDEGFSDYAVTKKANTTQLIDPRERGEQVHGDESYGLGTSTFLEGAPASRSALQRRETEDHDIPQAGGAMGGGLTRKRSLAQRFRGISSSRRGGPNSPEARYGSIELDNNSPPREQMSRGAISAGGPARARYTKENEVNPFDQSYDDAFEKKGAQIRIAEQERPSAGRSRAPSSPKGRGLVRSVTADGPTARGRGSSNESDRAAPQAQSGGFLSRMRSLKGGKRARPERRDT